MANTPKINDKKRIHIDTIKKDKVSYTVINRYPEENSKKIKHIEKRLFEIFKKYERL